MKASFPNQQNNRGPQWGVTKGKSHSDCNDLVRAALVAWGCTEAIEASVFT